MCNVKHLSTVYHGPEVCAQSASGLVVLHHTVVVQNLSTAVTSV